jgi:hypothetical protein
VPEAFRPATQGKETGDGADKDERLALFEFVEPQPQQFN